MPTPIRRNLVFINCPFDNAYKPIFDAIVFAIYDLGFVARSALKILRREPPPNSYASFLPSHVSPAIRQVVRDARGAKVWQPIGVSIPASEARRRTMRQTSPRSIGLSKNVFGKARLRQRQSPHDK